jgi:hypothetical protein
VKWWGQCWVAKFMSPGSCIILTAAFFCSCGELHTAIFGHSSMSPGCHNSESVLIAVCNVDLLLAIGKSLSSTWCCSTPAFGVAVNDFCSKCFLLLPRTCARTFIWACAKRLSGVLFALVAGFTPVYNSQCLNKLLRLIFGLKLTALLHHHPQNGIEWTKLLQ